MRDCDDALEALFLRAAGEIDHKTVRTLEDHLASCRRCADEAKRLDAVLQVMRREATPDPGPIYWSSFQARLEDRIANHGRRLRARTLAGLAAAILVVLGLAALWRIGRFERPTARRWSAAQEAAGESGAEARLENVLDRMEDQADGEQEFESILEELAPADPLAVEDAWERSGAGASDPDDGVARPEAAG